MSGGSQGPLVLVADDDPDVLALVSHRLEANGYCVVVARDGNEAIRLAEEHDAAVVLLDVSMPECDGLEACRVIRQASSFPPPVIFLTAHAHPDARVKGLDSGAVDYVVKPFSSAELLARVRAALRNREAEERFRADAARDGLTGVLVRAALDARAAELVALAARHDRPLACIFLDLDRFKSINDTFGHPTGDDALRAVGRQLSSLRISDVAGRFGGDEFVVLLPETRIEDGQRVAEKILEALEAAHVTAPGGDPVVVRASVGVAGWDESMQTAADLFAAADAALYRAKDAGRGGVASATAAV